MAIKSRPQNQHKAHSGCGNHERVLTLEVKTGRKTAVSKTNVDHSLSDQGPIFFVFFDQRVK